MVRFNRLAFAADSAAMGRGAIGICLLLGSTIGGYVPTMWGASSLGAQSLLFGTIGGIAGVLLGARLNDA
jgi:hypothetical protein